MDKGTFESDFENLVIDLLKEQGYTYVNGYEIESDGTHPERENFEDVILRDRLLRSLRRINPGFSDNILSNAVRQILQEDSSTLIQNNIKAHSILTLGVPVEYKRSDGSIAGDRVRVVDFDNIENNEFLAVNQFTVVGAKKRRPDVIIFINGLPVVVMELKNPADEKTTVDQAFIQIQNYIDEIPRLFQYNEICLISDGVQTKVGTISSDERFFKAWKGLGNGIEAPEDMGSPEVTIKGLLDKHTLLDVIRNFIVFDDNGRGVRIKKMAACHQYYGVNRLIESSVEATSKNGNRKCGVMWYTQGSGKSLMMTFYAGKIAQDPRMKNPTLVVLTDRIDLDDQLFDTFAHCSDLLRQTPQQADSRSELKKMLSVASGGIVFTTINKFFPENGELKYPVLTERANVIVMADEAHRSQYSLVDGFAAHLRDALPNASFVGFTGTPIDFSDRSTINVFGNYVGIYDIKEAIDDGVTVPIYYESRLVKINLPEDQKELLNESFDEIYEGTEDSEKEREKRKWSMLEALVGVEERIDLIAQDIIKHFEMREDSIDGKAMIVCMSRRICVDLYNAMIKYRPEWEGTDDTDSVLNVIMTGSATDPKEWQRHIRNKQGRSDLAIRFKDPKDPFKLVIVRDMWLTGFDVPCLHTMYVDKPMKGHGLMQAISRVNRVFKDKQGGLIVDYIGLADNLANAVGKYTKCGGKGTVFIDISQALNLFHEKYEVCKDLMHGYDWDWWFEVKRSERTQKMPQAMNYVLGLEDGKSRFKNAVRNLEKAYSLVNTEPDALQYKESVAFFQMLRAFINKNTVSKMSSNMKDEALRQMLSSALVSQEPTDVMDLLGYTQTDLSILSEDFLSRIRVMPEKNLAVELLQKLLHDKAKTMERTNIVQSRKFSELIQESLTKYEKHIIDTTQFINMLIEYAKEMRETEGRGKELGLTTEELAFYDALCTDGAADELRKDGTLRTIAMEVAQSINDNLTVDWKVREQAKAKIRITIKRLLKKYDYPPDKVTDATNLVLEQAERICQIKSEA